MLEKYLMNFTNAPINSRSAIMTETDNEIPVIAISDCMIMREIFKILSYECKESESL